MHYVTTGAGTGPRLLSPDVQTLALRDLDHPGRQPLSTLVVPRLKHAGRRRIDFESPALAPPSAPETT